MGGRAWAGGKPPIAILGLEVYDNGNGIDPDTTKAARELTAALRDRAKAGTGPYTPVQGGEKELIDEKLLNNCDTEANSCMAAIGSELGAEVLMYGRIWIEKSQGGQGTYKVSIKLLNVNRKQLASSTVETLPIAESTGVRATAHAKAWYTKLVGAVTGGTLAIKANIDRGTVVLDEEPKGNLTSGALTLTGLPEGRHTLVIEAKDYQRYEASITIKTGETTPQNVTMVETSKKAPTPGPIDTREGTVSAKSRSNIWKPVFYGTTVLDAGLVGFTIYEWQKARTNAPPNTSNSDCNGAMDAKLKNACSHYDKYLLGVVVSSVVGAAVIGSFVMAYMRDGSDSDNRSAVRGHHKRRELSVTPMVTPDGGGATLRFDW
jgi:hypothetical protein